MDELLEALEDMVTQHCSAENKNQSYHLYSMSLSANAKAMRLLAKHRRIVITSEFGERILAKWIMKA